MLHQDGGTCLVDGKAMDGVAYYCDCTLNCLFDCACMANFHDSVSCMSPF